MRFNIKKLKGETLMLELLPGIEEREKPGRKPAKITDMGTPIFKRIHARTMAAIDKSIEEANFRFHSKGLGENAPESVDEKSGKVTPAIKDGVYVTARASQCWKVHKANADSPGKGELVYVGIPCGNKFMPWLKNKAGKTVSRVLIDSEHVVKQLKAYKASLADLDINSEMGKDFHEHAIVNTEPPKQKKSGKTTRNTNKVGSENEDGQYYCANADQWLDTDYTVRDKMEQEHRKLDELGTVNFTKRQANRFADLEAELGG